MGNSYRVLGDLAVVTSSGTERHVSGRQGDILATLLAAHPDTVTVGRLIEEVWGDRVPKDPDGSLQTAVSRLRSVVGDDLVTTPTGYALRGGTVDSDEFETAMAVARKSGDLSDYRAAELKWAGDPYRGFDDLPSVRLEAERLTLLKRRALLERLRLMVDLGEASTAADELRTLVGEDAFDEEALGTYMRGLYMAGNKAAALHAFARYETLLAEETGLEPSASIRELELAILVDHLEPIPTVDARPATRIDLSISYVELQSGLRIAVGTAGSGPPLLVHPGWLSKLDLLATGLDMRSPLWSAMAGSHRLTIFDRSGTGLSRPGQSGLSFDESVAELIAVLDATMDGPVPVWAGSGAGPIAIKAAVERPELVSHLILYGTYASGPTTFHSKVADSMVALVKASWGVGSDVLSYLLFPSSSAEARDAWARAQRDMAEPDTAAGLLRQMFDADVTPWLSRVEAESLVVHYRQDKAVPARGSEQLARGISGARYIALDGRSHYPLPGEEQSVVDLIDAFLEETAG